MFFFSISFPVFKTAPGEKTKGPSLATNWKSSLYMSTAHNWTQSKMIKQSQKEEEEEDG